MALGRKYKTPTDNFEDLDVYDKEGLLALGWKPARVFYDIPQSQQTTRTVSYGTGIR